MRAQLTPLIAALLAAGGCASTPPAPPASSLPQSNTSSTSQNCTPQPSAETSSSATQAIPAVRQPTQTAAQRRALIDKRLSDLRRSLNGDANGSYGGGDPPNGDGNSSLHPASLRLHDSRAPAGANPGNGATNREMPNRSGDDIVVRRLRKAAEQETDPGLKQKLWQEWADYRKNVQGK
jgi:hypothetical protein